jgi:hypothetical protein
MVTRINFIIVISNLGERPSVRCNPLCARGQPTTMYTSRRYTGIDSYFHSRDNRHKYNVHPPIQDTQALYLLTSHRRDKKGYFLALHTLDFPRCYSFKQAARYEHDTSRTQMKRGLLSDDGCTRIYVRLMIAESKAAHKSQSNVLRKNLFIGTSILTNYLFKQFRHFILHVVTYIPHKG